MGNSLKMSTPRYSNNPLIAPSSNSWESFATFNPSVIHTPQNKMAIFYRAEGTEEEVLGHRLRVSRIGKATGFEEAEGNKSSRIRREIFLEPHSPWDQFGCEDPRVVFFEGKYYIFYTALGGYPFSADNIRVGVAISKDLASIEARHLVTPFNAKAMSLFPERIDGKITGILTVHTDLPPAHVAIIQAEELTDLWDPHFWYHWYENLGSCILPLERLNTDHVECGASPVLTDRGWLLVYSHIQNYRAQNLEKIFGIEAVILDRESPQKILQRSKSPLLIPEAKYELEGTIKNIVFPSSARLENDRVDIFYGAADTVVAKASWSTFEFWPLFSSQQAVCLKAAKLHTPLLEPRPELSWERNGVFNPGVWDDGENIHLLYRAQSDAWTSTFGYSKVTDIFSVTERSSQPIYVPRASFEKKLVPEGYSGCEDPRLVAFGDQIYMTYTAFDGANPPRIALTHISITDFKAERWNWSAPVLISAAGVMNKNAFLLPEKINGKFAIIHRIEPNICIDYLDDLNFDGSRFLTGEIKLAMPRQEGWDSLKIGAGAPPLKTNSGWLLIYHGVDARDRQYRAGAMLLDLNDLSHVRARTRFPILEPELPWEVHGVVNNVVFPCGMAVRDKRLHIFYGAADYCIGLATLDLATLMEYLDVGRSF